VRLEVTIDGRTALGRRLDQLSGSLPLILERFGYTVEGLVREEFDNSEDPYGRPWVPLKMREGKPLRDTTTHLLGSLTHEVLRTWVRVGFGFRYAHVHQFGAVIVPVRAKRLRYVPRGWQHPVFSKKSVIPARPMLPAAGWPDYWVETLAEVAQSILRNPA
jgi:phage gpG-like protein